MADATAALHPDLTLRPICDGDLPFLAHLYGTTRSGELAVVPWSEEQKTAFLASQFDAQHRFYTEQFGTARFDLIELDGAPAGRFYVDRRSDEIRVIDIALLPEHRGGGRGGALLRALLDEANRAGLPVTLHVEPSNPAVRLYERLGFRLAGDAGTGDEQVYQFMRWDPEGRVG